ncbi:MAG: CheR family methyltransferase, partial [Aureliella sp.]
YSLAMALLEFLDDKPVRPPIQIFATDLSHDVSLSAARVGVYPHSIEAEVSPERLRRFFTKEDGKYRINKSIRDLCVFAKQNIVADPPFSRVDLISCRNVLIYLSPTLQKRVIPTFHYALNPTGVLMLGNSESVGSFTNLFETLDNSHRIYSKKTTAFRQYPHFQTDEYAMTGDGDDKPVSIQAASPADFQIAADRIVLGQYAPPGVLVNEALEILQFRGRTSPYLEPVAGTASLKLLNMVRDGLFVEIKHALAEAKQNNAPVERSGVQLRDGENTRDINLRVSPVKLPGHAECCYLVLFEEIDTHTRSRSARQSSTASSGGMMAFFGAFLRRPKLFTSSANSDSGQRERERNELHSELAATREQSQALAEQHDAAIEELKSANEEILSSNEELQSTNEEMETAKEELQSTNEELITVNDQLQTRNLELNLLTNDLTNLLASAGVPLVVLSSDLRVRRFSPAAAKVLNLTADTVGCPVSNVKLGIEIANLESLLDEVQATVQVIEREIQDSDGHWYDVRLHPYRTEDNRIDGAVLVFLDINAVKMSQLQLQVASDFTDAIVLTLHEPFLVLTSDLRVKSANQAFFAAFQVTPQETEQRLIYELGSGQWDQPSLRTLLTEVLTKEAAFDNYEVKFDFPSIGARVMLLNARRLIQADGVTELILLALQDITDRVKLQDELIEISRNKDNFLAVLGHELRNPLSSVVSGIEALSTHKLNESDDRELFDVIGRQAKLITRLVDDLLDMSRISAGKIQLQKKRFDLVKLVSHVVGDHRHHAESNQLTLTNELPTSPLYIVGDEVRLSQVIKNLLNNATKFTDAGGSIEITLELGEDESHQKQATIRVQDTGIGMDSATVGMMFQEFHQADSSIARSRGGLGLGMALSRRLVTMHGGKISASSDGLGQGSCFTLELPACEDQTTAPESTKPLEMVELKSHRILIVDDQRALRLPMKHLLKSLGQEVVEACDGTTALEIAVHYRPEIILCDIGLPDIDGYCVARAIRDSAELSGV